ncbi:MAG: STAS/SEC14 domain-containing protein [Candidatus Margulisiibacteriota bacterium]
MEAKNREIRAGKNTIYLDEDNILHFINVGEIDEEIARQSADAMGKVAAMGKGTVNYLIDLNKGGKTTPEARKILREYTESQVKGKLAFWGLHPVARVLASFFMGIAKKKDMRFFKTEEEALKWLKG